MNNSKLFLFSFLLLPFLFAGCFNEPEPAYKSVPAENRVYLSEKGLKDLAKTEFKAGAAIDYVNLDRNALTNINKVAGLTGLKWLRLNNNQLSTLPDLKALVKLRRIYLKANRLTAVPETLKDLPELTDVELSLNPIREVPQWLVDKPGLLHVSFNQTMITKLPENLEGWKNLKSLQLGELRMSAEEMARIRKALPKVAIVF